MTSHCNLQGSGGAIKQVHGSGQVQWIRPSRSAMNSRSRILLPCQPTHNKGSMWSEQVINLPPVGLEPVTMPHGTIALTTEVRGRPHAAFCEDRCHDVRLAGSAPPGGKTQQPCRPRSSCTSSIHASCNYYAGGLTVAHHDAPRGPGTAESYLVIEPSWPVTRGRNRTQK